MNKKKVGAILMILGSLLLVAAILIAVYNYSLQRKAERASKEILAELRENYSFPKINEQIVLKKTAEPEKPFDNPYTPLEETAVVDNEKYIGILQIPSLKIELPVTKDFSYDSLKKSPCRYSGSASEKNLVICAHNYSSHFGGLNKLLNGDEIRFIGFNGNVYVYSVSGIEQIKPSDISAVTDDNFELTLFTCNLSGNARVAVKCELIGSFF